LLRAHLTRGYTGWTRPHDRTGRFVLPATTSVTLVLKVEDSAVRPPEFVHGAQAGFTVIDGGCAPRYVEIALSPLGAYQLFGLPMNQLTGSLLDFTDLLGREGRRLGDVVRDAPTWSGRFDAIDRFFLRRMDTAPAVAAEVVVAWRHLVATGGTIPIRSICREVGWSHKHLITRFRQHIGITPKRAARVIRFERMLRRISADLAPDWGRVAADCGYADQAHLIRDFAEFAGTTPAAAARDHAAQPGGA
jgi:AraC-like DNA-binding protein